MNRQSSIALTFLALLILLTVASPGSEAALDIYGGDDRLTGTATGFFHTEKINGRYYVVTPLGNVFWSVGPTTNTWGGQAALAVSYITDYQALRAKYADPADPNNNTKARDNWAAAFRARYAEWEQNTIAGFSQDINTYGSGPKITETFRVMFVHPRFTSMGGKSVAGEKFPDVFDEPTWSNAVAADILSDVVPYVNDPWRLGVYPDNEISWSNHDNHTEHLPGAFFAIPSTPGKTHWIESILKPQYTTIAALNAAWGTAYTSWDGVESTSFLNETVIAPDNPTFPAIRQDKIAFLRAVAEKYFSSIAIPFRAADPNHLFFSNRIGLFHGTYEPAWDDYNEVVWEVAGNYCDVIAINSYQDPAALGLSQGYFDRVFQKAKKPIMITEWNRLADDGMMPVLTGANGEANQARRAESAWRYAEDYWKLGTNQDPNDGQPAKFMLGLHWFQIYDEPPTGRFDGERWNAGHLTILDETYLTLMRPLADLWKQKYDHLILGAAIQQPRFPDLAAPREGAVVETNRPTLSWKAVSGAVRYDVLLSPTNYFGEEQCLRADGLTSLSWTPDVDLGNGRWYWCVRSVNANGIGGTYTDPASFLVRNREVASASDVFGFESLAGWRGNERGDAGGWGTAMARQDAAIASEGGNSVRLDFTGFTFNRLNTATNVDAIENSKVAAGVQPPTGTAALTGPFSSLPLQFADDFNDGDDYGWVLMSGTWIINSNAYRQNSTSTRGGRVGTMALIADAEYQFDMRIVAAAGSNRWGGVLLRRQDPAHGPFESGYLIGVRQNGAAFIYRWGPGLAIEEPGVVADPSIYNTFNVVHIGDEIRVYVNNVLWQTWTDPDALYDSGYFALTSHETRVDFDNVAIWSNNPIPAAPVFDPAEVAFEWWGGRLDYSSASAIEFDVYPFRILDQAGTRLPASRYLHFRMKNDQGGVVVDQPVDPAGTFPVEAWSTASIPVGATPRGQIASVEFYMNTGEFGFPLDQRMRIHLDRMTRPDTVSPAPLIAWRQNDIAETFDASHLDGWTLHHGVAGADGGSAYVFSHRKGPAMLIAESDPVINATFKATLAAMDDYYERRVWIVFGYDPADDSFRFGGFDARNGRWELGRWTQGQAVVDAQLAATFTENTDYDVEIVVTGGKVEIFSDGVKKAQVLYGAGKAGRFGFGSHTGRVRAKDFHAAVLDASAVGGWKNQH